MCGGWIESGMASSLVECYSIDEDAWSSVAALPTPSSMRCVSLTFPRKRIEEIVNSQEDIKKLEARRVAEDLL